MLWLKAVSDRSSNFFTFCNKAPANCKRTDLGSFILKINFQCVPCLEGILFALMKQISLISWVVFFLRQHILLHLGGTGKISCFSYMTRLRIVKLTPTTEPTNNFYRYVLAVCFCGFTIFTSLLGFTSISNNGRIITGQVFKIWWNVVAADVMIASVNENHGSLTRFKNLMQYSTYWRNDCISQYIKLSNWCSFSIKDYIENVIWIN